MSGCEKYRLTANGCEIGYEADTLVELLWRMGYTSSASVAPYFRGTVDVYDSARWRVLVEDYRFSNPYVTDEDRRDFMAREWLARSGMPRSIGEGQTVVRIIGVETKYLLLDAAPALEAVNDALEECFPQDGYRVSVVGDSGGAIPSKAVRCLAPPPHGKRWHLEREGIPTGYCGDTVLEVLRALERHEPEPCEYGEDRFLGNIDLHEGPDEWGAYAEELFWGIFGSAAEREEEMWNRLEDCGMPLDIGDDQMVIAISLNDDWDTVYLLSDGNPDPVEINKLLAVSAVDAGYRIVEG